MPDLGSDVNGCQVWGRECAYDVLMGGRACMEDSSMRRGCLGVGGVIFINV